MSLTVTAADFASIAPGSAKCLEATHTESSKKVPVIIFKKKAESGGGALATINNCQHMSAKFAPDLEDVGKMKCTFHGWKLDPSTMQYVDGSNPKVLGFEVTMKGDKRTQPQLVVATSADGSLTLTATEGAKLPTGAGGCTAC